MKLSRFVATFGGCGLAPRAPGTVGSLAALLLGLPLLKHPKALVGAIGAASLLGWWASDRAGEGEDHSWIVIDEVAGMWVSLLACLPENPEDPASVRKSLGLSVLAFGLFRLFDIKKPGPVGYLDRKHGATGIMGDDLVAGVMAAACIKAGRLVTRRFSFSKS
ncbi:phosphatidylglycerophosphatase A family protein [Acetobacter orleanensis]|uniref:Phosphatidylglycerophosphatase A n=1 Tax=Acetobacter orleanensis TaxID=104099 RepID=A0A4Y3TFA3_9PROT|nr:phosphatidylglycerophosphatase A [Acetobacter orleanensis]KXV63106.1 phosphatidylglycerophosphatase [Acetobacter orleanensis]PCD80268.1 phosphatidylglycerophosphatase A [Acetobacter orleanensis]GAN68991.1 phosphatidylglycerophosphatase [Acetobacter orleanensis JCM 7639]GBR30494.1 phosphatidylglycerophosphatase [Acetobacter orleanensis NRIC 0473]GEB81601.1 phosphatidylglycerophosphatase A [Acetobacter orleanensis]